jgi:hypothetical protein
MKIEQLFEILIEAPVDNFRFLDTGEHQGIGTQMLNKDYKGSNNPYQTMTKPDFNLLTSPTYEINLRKFFKNTDHVFNLYFINSVVKGRRALTTRKNRNTQGIDFDEQLMPFHNFYDAHEDIMRFKTTTGKTVGQILKNEAERDGINIVLLGNKSEAMLPLSPWIVAHRIGHILEKSEYANEIFIDYYSNHLNDEIAQVIDWEFGEADFWHIFGTFKAAREQNLRFAGEGLTELFAQYIYTGVVKLSRNFDKLDEIKKFYLGNKSLPLSDKEKISLDEVLSDAEQHLTRLFEDALTTADGKWALI